MSIYGTYYPNGVSVRAMHMQDIPQQFSALKDLCSVAAVQFVPQRDDDDNPYIRVTGTDLHGADSYRGRPSAVLIQKGDWVVVDYNFATKRTEVRVYDNAKFQERFHPDEATRKRLHSDAKLKPVLSLASDGTLLVDGRKPTRAPANDAEQEPEADLPRLITAATRLIERWLEEGEPQRATVKDFARGVQVSTNGGRVVQR